jgi:hypothetical protein
MFDMSNDSGLFVTEPREGYVRLYEAKMFWHFDHRWSTFEGEDTRELRNNEKKNPAYFVIPRYWVPKSDVDQRLGEYQRKWLIGFRDITNATNERTAIFSILPRSGVGNNGPLLIIDQTNAKLISCLIANLCAFAFDFPSRHKVGGTHINFFIAKQLSVIPPNYYTSDNIEFIAPRVLELIFTAYDLKPFADDMGHQGEPFCWDEERRALLRSELDAYYAKLYGLTRDELRYILDPQDVYGPDFPGETFRVLKEKEIKKFGEYRTRRLVLEAWDRLVGMEIGNPEGYRGASSVGSAAPEVKSVSSESAESRSAAGPALVEAEKSRSESESPAQPESQPMLSDYGLYKCGECGKLVIGYDKENHEREKHTGKNVEWRKMK